MSQTILVEENTDLKDLYSLNLSTILNTNVIVRKNAEDAINLLKILPDINLIIIKNKINDESSAFIVSEFIESEQLQIPMIILGENKDLAKNHQVLPEPVKLETLIDTAGKLLGLGGIAESQEKAIPDYIPVSATYFLNLTETPCDIYIRIKKSPSEFQFVKRIHVRDHFSREDIEKYMMGGLKEFYVPKDFRVNFTKYVTNQIIKKLEKKDLPPDERFKTNADSYDFVRDYIQKFGFDDTAIELTESTINSINHSVKANPQLNQFLEMLKKNKVSYAYQHCHLLALLGFNILKNLDWGSTDQFDKMCFVAFFHDISLSNDEMMKIGTTEELETSGLSSEDKTEVLEHAKRSAEMILTHADAPFGVDIVIMQHHGATDGVGFSDDYHHPLSPLAMVIIVIEEFINEVFILKKALNLKEVFARLHTRFHQTNYEKIVVALEKSIAPRNA